MAFQFIRSIKTFIAKLALVRPVSAVYPLVPVQVGRVRKRFLAKRAFVRFLFRVFPQVLVKIALMSELFAAVRARHGPSR